MDHYHPYETHGGNNMLASMYAFDMSKYPMFSAQGEEIESSSLIDDIYNDIDEYIIDNPIIDNQKIIEENPQVNEVKVESNEIASSKIETNENVSNEQEIKSNQSSSQHQKTIIPSIEEFTAMKKYIMKQHKEKEREKMLIFVALIGICVILILNNKKH